MNKNKIEAEEMVITFSQAIDSLTDAEFEGMLSSVRRLQCKSDPVAEYLAYIGWQEDSSIYFPNIKNLFLAV